MLGNENERSQSVVASTNEGTRQMIQMILSGQNKVSAVEQGENRTSLLNLLDSQEHTGMREQANAF